MPIKSVKWLISKVSPGDKTIKSTYVGAAKEYIGVYVNEWLGFVGIS